MPKNSPFTLLCQAAAKIANPKRVDLHSHTTASDGDFTPSQVVVQARTAGLVGLAITDHDTTHGLAEARATVFETRPVEIISGAEISTLFNGVGYHLLGLCFDLENRLLQSGLAAIRERRRVRFKQYLDVFTASGVMIPDHLLAPLEDNNIAVGRRHLAKLLVAAGYANTLHIAFLKHIHPANIPGSHSVPIAEAFKWIHDAGGFASLAHPPQEITLDVLKELQALGLDAVEGYFPSGAYGHSEDLKAHARTLGLGMTGGSDFHGGGHTLGSRGIDFDAFNDLKQKFRV